MEVILMLTILLPFEGRNLHAESIRGVYASNGECEQAAGELVREATAVGQKVVRYRCVVPNDELCTKIVIGAYQRGSDMESYEQARRTCKERFR